FRLSIRQCVSLAIRKRDVTAQPLLAPRQPAPDPPGEELDRSGVLLMASARYASLRRREAFPTTLKSAIPRPEPLGALSAPDAIPRAIPEPRAHLGRRPATRKDTGVVCRDDARLVRSGPPRARPVRRGSALSWSRSRGTQRVWRIP